MPAPEALPGGPQPAPHTGGCALAWAVGWGVRVASPTPQARVWEDHSLPQGDGGNTDPLGSNHRLNPEGRVEKGLPPRGPDTSRGPMKEGGDGGARRMSPRASGTAHARCVLRIRAHPPGAAAVAEPSHAGGDGALLPAPLRWAVKLLASQPPAHETGVSEQPALSPLLNRFKSPQLIKKSGADIFY